MRESTQAQAIQTPSKRIVGLDISKQFHVAWTQGQKPLKVPHSKAGLRGLVKWLGQIEPGADFVFGLEPTGRYSETVRAWLVAWGFEVVMVPGAFVKRAKYFYTRSGLKTDDIDAEVIAGLVGQG